MLDTGIAYTHPRLQGTSAEELLHSLMSCTVSHSVLHRVHVRCVAAAERVEQQLAEN